MYKNMRAKDVMTFNNGRRCYVDGVNTAASVSSGQVMVVIADDQYPCPHWDTRLKQSVGEALAKNKEFVLWPHTGTNNEYERGIVVMPIVSRARFERLGYIFYPQYESMYADNDLCTHAMRDGVLHRLPSDWVFPHRHPFFSDTPMDAAYEAQNRQEAYTLGAEIYRRRQSAAFAEIPPVVIDEAGARKTLAVCMPGREFPLEFVSNWTTLLIKLIPHVNVIPIFGYAPDPGIVRQTMAQIVQTECQPVPDFVLWIDSDNLPDFTDVMTCLKTLSERADIDAVAAWCWLLSPGGAISCGKLRPVCACDPPCLTTEPLDYVDMMAGADDLIEVDYSGFPTIVMRFGMLKQAGPFPFQPLVGAHYMNGKVGEDISFSIRARAAGARLVVDRRLKVPHLKLGALDCEAQARALHQKQPAAPATEQIPVPMGEAI
jgi:hypothetical protein